VSKHVHSAQAKALDGLRAVCLTFLQLKGGKCSDEELWAFLAHFGLYSDKNPAQDHAGAAELPGFGMTASAAVAALVSLRVLSYETEALAGEVLEIYTPGDAATGEVAELTEKGLKKVISEMIA